VKTVPVQGMRGLIVDIKAGLLELFENVTEVRFMGHGV